MLRFSRLTWMVLTALSLLLLVPTLAFANDPVHQTSQLPIPMPLVWSVLVTWFTPILGYIANGAFFKGLPEYFKVLVSTIITAGASAITQAVTSADFSFSNSESWTIIGISVMTSLAIAHPIWHDRTEVAAGIRRRLGA